MPPDGLIDHFAAQLAELRADVKTLLARDGQDHERIKALADRLGAVERWGRWLATAVGAAAIGAIVNLIATLV